MSERERACLDTARSLLDQIIFPKSSLRECCFLSPTNKYKGTRREKEREDRALA